jgi:hypothetical protein
MNKRTTLLLLTGALSGACNSGDGPVGQRSSEPTTQAPSAPGGSATGSDVTEATVVFRDADGNWQSRAEVYDADQFATLVRERENAQAPRSPARSSEANVSVTPQAISVASCSNALALWIYDRGGPTPDGSAPAPRLKLCVIDSGTYRVPTTSPVYHNIGAIWPGKDWGEVFEFQGKCGNEVDFNARASYTTISSAFSAGFDTVELNTRSCWIN